MVKLRHWAHEQISKLDRERERKVMAWSIAALFLVVVSLPSLLKAATQGETEDTSTGTTLTLTKAEATGDLTARLEARSEGDLMTSVLFTITSADGSSASLTANKESDTKWVADWVANEGGTYKVKASGSTVNEEAVFSDPGTFTLTGTPPPDPPTIDLVEVSLVSGTDDLIFMKAQVFGGQMSSVTFEITGITDQTYSANVNGIKVADGVWEGQKVVPTGADYEVVAGGVSGGGDNVASNSRGITINTPPEDDDGTSEQTSSATITVLPARLDESDDSVIIMEVDVSGDPFEKVIFTITGPNGTSLEEADKVGSDLWRATRKEDRGASYSIHAKGRFADGTEVSSANTTSIEVPEANSEESTSEETASTGTQSEISLRMVSPVNGSTLSGLINLVAELFGATGESLTFVVTNEVGDEFLSSGTYNSDLGIWKGVFDGPGGSYTVRAKALIDASSFYSSSEITFTVKNEFLSDPAPAPEPADEEPKLLTEEPEPDATPEEIAGSETEAGIAPQEPIEETVTEATAITEPKPTPILSSTTEQDTDKDETFLVDEKIVKEEKIRTEETIIREEDIKLATEALGDNEKDKEYLKGLEAKIREDLSITNEAVIIELAQECRAAGILRNRCNSWLKVKHSQKDCRKAGILTRESCSKFLEEIGTVADEKELIAYAPEKDLEEIRETAKPFLGTSVSTISIPTIMRSVMSSIPGDEEQVLMIESASPRTGTGEASPGIWTFDSDGDGLPNDIELRLGSDPYNADTDNDGFSDGDEVRNDFNPVGEGGLRVALRGVELALLNKTSLEEPRGIKETDASLRVESVTNIDALTEEDTPIIRLTGRALPNSIVSIFVYSYLPVVVTTTTDADGNWKYDFSSKLAEGQHEAYVSINDDTGKLVATSEPLAFFIKTARAVSEEEFLRGDVNVTAPEETFTRYFIYGGMGIVFLALLLTITLVRQVRSKDPTELQA